MRKQVYFDLEGHCTCSPKINHFPWHWLHTIGELQKNYPFRSQILKNVHVRLLIEGTAE